MLIETLLCPENLVTAQTIARRGHARIRIGLMLGAALVCAGCNDDPPPPKPPAAHSAAVATSSAARPNNPVAKEAVAAKLKSARVAAMAFQKALKGTLMKAMSTGGPVAAIDVCNKEAPGIADKVDTGGWDVRRTTLKARNPKNVPDVWEKKILKRFEAEKAAGKAIGELEAHEVVTSSNGRELRYMQAIGTGGPCLTCHGTDIADDVTAALKTRYPKDTATGFAPGDIRGAFSMRRKL